MTDADETMSTVEGLGDSRLEGLRWSRDGSDLIVDLRFPGASGTRTTLHLVWATNVSVLMEFGEYAGPPLVFESVLTRLPSDRWRLEIQFAGAPVGHLKCECDGIMLS